MHTHPLVRMILLCLPLLAGCGAAASDAPVAPPTPSAVPPTVPPPAPPAPIPPTWNVDSLGLPRFVSVDYIESARVSRISRFRSAAGHDNSDDFETCRSMKHYFQPAIDAEAGTIVVRSPVTGVVTRIFVEWAGTQVHITSEAYPAFTFAIFHVNLAAPVAVGQRFTVGQVLGTHIGAQTASDIAVIVATPPGRRFVSWFDVMTDSLFNQFQLRGVATRDSLIISRAVRDADPLNCDVYGGFVSFGNVPSWVALP